MIALKIASYLITLGTFVYSSHLFYTHDVAGAFFYLIMGLIWTVMDCTCRIVEALKEREQ